MTEIVDNGKTGLLVERGDAQALAEALTTLINNNELRRSMGEAGRQRIEKFFSWDGIADELLHQYEQLVGDES
jgi:glycosyltransferase involved in cell wall biosynthesis